MATCDMDCIEDCVPKTSGTSEEVTMETTQWAPVLDAQNINPPDRATLWTTNIPSVDPDRVEPSKLPS